MATVPTFKEYLDLLFLYGVEVQTVGYEWQSKTEVLDGCI